MPVTQRASSLARYTAPCAMSQAVPSVCVGTIWRRRSRASAPMCATIGVCTEPMMMQLARMFSVA